MTNLNTPTLRELAALNEQELDAAIARHFGPRRHTEPTARPEPMPFKPASYEAAQARWHRGHVAACTSDACLSGKKRCPTPDACRIPANGDGNPDGDMEMLAYALMAAIVVALVLWAAS